MRWLAVYRPNNTTPIAMFRNHFEADHFIGFAPEEWGTLTKKEEHWVDVEKRGRRKATAWTFTDEE